MVEAEAASVSVGEPPLLAASGITKRFGGLVANDAIDLTVRPGEIHALLGENGAGKSTLVKILYGALQPDAGTIRWRGETVRLASPAAARRLGIGMVFQHFSLFEALTVAENIALSIGGAVRGPALRRRIETVSREYGLPVAPDQVVADLSVGEHQRIEIVRCLLQDPHLIIMDEPTSVLTPGEAKDLFRILKRLAAEGRSILTISHRLEEVRAIADRATILRRGKVVAETDPRRETARSLARMMVGEALREVTAPPLATEGPVRLAVKGLTLPRGRRFGVDLDNISFDVRAGEILGIAGVAGNGQTELFGALSGERPPASDEAILIDGAPIGRSSISDRRGRGVAFVPEERLGHGLVPRMPLSANVVLTRHGKGDGAARGGFVDRGATLVILDRVATRFDVRKSARDPEAASLSGGNLQRFQVGREIDRNPAVLIVDQPSWGIDVAASVAVRQAIVDLARAGSAVVMISQDLDEIFEISDRVAVMARGRLTEPRPARELTPETIGLMMAGATASEAGAADAH